MSRAYNLLISVDQFFAVLLFGTSGTPVIVNTTSYVSGGVSQIVSITLSKA